MKKILVAIIIILIILESLLIVKIGIKREQKNEEEFKIKKVPVIVYHGISDIPLVYEEMFVRANDFNDQIEWLLYNGYETVFVEDIENDFGDKKVVALTFDDGYVDFYTTVLPIIKKYNIKANLYLITDRIGKENYLTEEQIKEISASGLVSIGSHTVSHKDLISLNKDMLEKELKYSKEYLEDLIGKEIKILCYPMGYYDSSVIDIVKKYYKYALKVDGGIQIMDDTFNDYEIKRLAVYRSTNINEFIYMINYIN